MSSHTVFAVLRNILATLYIEEQAARLVVDDAGIDARQIDFSGRAQTNWRNILIEAIRQNRLNALLDIARDQYLANQDLVTAYTTYQHFLEQGRRLEPPSELEPNPYRIPSPALFLAPPPPPYNLIGRDDQLRNLKRRLFTDRNPALTALNGLPGVGKTALAIQLAHDREVWDHFPDGVLWAGLGRSGDPLSLLGNWARALGIPSSELGRLTTVAERASAVGTAIGTRRLLLVVDDAWTPESALAFQVGGPNCAHLITTRLAEVALCFAGQAETVPELSKRDGVTLLAQIAPDVVAAEFETAQELVEAVAGLPLALVLMGNYLRVEGYSGQPRRIRQALAELHTAQGRLRVEEVQTPARQHPSLPEGVKLSLQAAIMISEKALDDQARRALYSLSVFPSKPNSFSEEAGIVVSGVPAVTLDKLTDVAVLESAGAGRYKMHQTIADYGRWKLTDEAAQARMGAFFVSLAEEAEPALMEPDQAIWLDRLETEYDNLRSVLRWSGEHSEIEMGLRLGGAISRFFYVRGYLSEGRDRLTELLARAGSLSRTIVYAKALSSAGLLASAQGDYMVASKLYEESLAIRRELGDKPGIAALLNNQGNLAYHQSNYAAARKLFEKSLAIRRELGDKPGIAALLNNQGNLAYYQGNYAAARELIEESLAILRELGNKHSIASPLNNLGMVAQDQGDYAAARAYYEESLMILREFKDKQSIAAALANLGGVIYDQGEYATARAFYEESLVIRQELGDKEGIALSFMGLGGISHIQGDDVTACTFYKESLEIFQELGDKRNIAHARISLGHAVCKLGDDVTAYALYKESLEICQELGDKRGAAYALDGLMCLSAMLGLSEHAIRLSGATAALRESIGLSYPLVEQAEFEHYLEIARLALNEDAVNQAVAEGRMMTLDQTITYALGRQG